ncbi:MAG: peptidylprolyl isomerase [Nitrosopumilaceae archaeon]|nr:peptidylprolyl isomerase [Nitrosopumilaceae archaeon]
MHLKLIIIFSLLLIPLQSFSQEEEKLVIFHTPSGKLVIELFPEDAPKTVENFLKLAESKFYDRTIFHRIQNFTIQGGDPLTKPGAYEHVSQWGTGLAGYTIPAEFNDIKHKKGIVSMIRAPTDPDSASSQFFIVHKDASHLDGKYTAFGRLVTQESYETLDKIASLETAPNGIAFQWGDAEILKTEVVSRSQVLDLLELGKPEKMEKPTGEISGSQYSNKKLGFSFLAPEGWVLQQPQKTQPIIPDVTAVGPKVNGIPPAIYVSVNEKNGKSFEEYITEVKDSLQKSIESGKLVILNENKTTVNGKSAYEINVIQSSKNIVNLKLKSVIILGPDKFYTIVYVNSEENFDSKLHLFDEALNSFTILSNETNLQTNNETQNNGGGCLIATAAFGSELSPQIQLLREIRDNMVLETHSGATFMSVFNSLYYSFSPTIADLERQNPTFKEVVKIVITPLISTLSILQHVDIDSEAEMIGYGIGIILLNIGMYFIAPAFVLLKLNSKYQDEKNKI